MAPPGDRGPPTEERERTDPHAWEREPPSYPPTPHIPLAASIDSTRAATMVLVALVVFLGGWVWQTNARLTELQVQAQGHVSQLEFQRYALVQDEIKRKVDILYDRIVENPR